MANFCSVSLFVLLYISNSFGIDIPNSCINQQDTNDLIIQPINNDNYPSLNVKCSNEYIIIDINKDKNWLKYFKSSRLYHYAIYGPEKDDHSNWNEWYLPSSISYLVSPDCSTCDITSELNIIYTKSSSYYMTPTGSQCTQIPISRIGCDMDYNTYECRVCETELTREPGYWLSYPIYNGLNDDNIGVMHNFNEIELMQQYKYGLCMFTIRDANAVHTDDSFKHCKTATHEDLISEEILPRRKPSIGSNGQFCVCVKPENLEYYDIDIVDEQQEEEKAIPNAMENEDESGIYELWQKHFMDGTYRITKKGRYILMEDIIFDFKAPDGYMDGNLDTYNGPNDWWPTVDQVDDYPGAGDNMDSYFLGFWAGITIECNDVILDLNGYKLEMSKAFYYQQAFFALISLTSQVFLPGQGPGWFGADLKSAQNVIIRNGELGLTSHHGMFENVYMIYNSFPL